MTKAQDWEHTLDDLERRRRHTLAMGGTERVAKHRDKGKLDVRARIDRLLDKGSFRELGTLVGGEIAADGISRRFRHSSTAPPSWSARRTSPRWRAASVPAATPSATASPNWRCATGFRW